jgi:hypothetical protein
MVRWWLLVHCGDASLNSCDVAVVRKTMQSKSSVDLEKKENILL